MREAETTVATYQLLAGNGRLIRKATKVIFPNGQEIRFTERMGKREAIAQAIRLTQGGSE